MKDFLKETDFAGDEINKVFALAKIFKENRGVDDAPALFGKSLGMLFYKSSTRTRISFEVGINELGGKAVILDRNAMQLTRGETIVDTAKIMSRYLHGLIVRCFSHDTIEEFANNSTIPVVNALTDFLHPCQSYSDAFTMAERWANGGDLVHSLKGRKIAFIGDTACNMANSWILAANLFGMRIVLAGPEGFEPGEGIRKLLVEEGYGENFTFTHDPVEAALDADVVYTDVWVSMGDEGEEAFRVKKMQPFTVSQDIMKHAKPDALFMHCLPAHPGMEVTEEVLHGPQSIILDQAENRLHMQKAIMALLVEANQAT